MVNKVILIGRLTHDLELNTSQNGVEYTMFNLAVGRRANENETDFIDCVAFRNQAVNLAKYMRKGSLIGVEGSLQVSEYDPQDGSPKRRNYRIIANQVTFLESKKDRARKENLTSNKEDNELDDTSDIPFDGIPY